MTVKKVKNSNSSNKVEKTTLRLKLVGGVKIRFELKKRARKNGFNQPIRVRARQNKTSPQEKVFMVVARRV